MVQKINNHPHLKNTENLQEIKIEDISDFTFLKLDTKYYLDLLQYIDSHGLIDYVKSDLIELTTFGSLDNNFHLFYNVHLMNLLSILDSEQDYYVSNRNVILYGLKSCLTKIPMHLSFFENLYFLYTYNYKEHIFLTYPINLNDRLPNLNCGIKSACLGINPAVYLESSPNIGTLAKSFI